MIALALLACAADKGDTAPPVDLLTRMVEPGPYAVGYAETRLETADLTGAARGLRLAIWYPTGDSEGDEAAYFMGSVPAEGVWAEATPAAGPFPLAVFSHGHQGYAENSGFLMEHLASHGFVVAAPDHTGNTILDGDDRTTAIYYQRPGDISAVIDAAQAGALPAPGISDEVIALGHSFGGYTLHALGGAAYDEALIAACLDGSDTSAYCSTMSEEDAARFRAGFADPRIAAFISMAPGDYRLFGEGLGQIAAPVLHMTGELDPATGGDADDIWAALAGGQNLRVELLGGGHQSFTDYSGVLESFDGLIDPEEGWRITDAYALAFASYHLGDASAAPVLDGEITVSEQAVLMR